MKHRTSRRRFLKAGSAVLGTLAAPTLLGGFAGAAVQASTPPMAPPSPRVAFPTLFTQMNAPGDLLHRGWGADLAHMRGLTTLVVQGINDNQLLQQVPRVVPMFRAVGGKRVLLYQLPEVGFYARYAIDRFRLRDSTGKIIPSSDNAQIMCVADPAYRALWIKYATNQIAEFGLDGLFADGPAGWGRIGKDSNGVTQTEPHKDNIEFFKEMRAAFGDKYISANVGGSYYYYQNWPGASIWDFAPYIDEYSFELPFATDGSVEHYDFRNCAARMTEMRKAAFELKRNVMIWSTREAPADRQSFEYACHLMFVGHPFDGPSKTGSLVHFGVPFEYDAKGIVQQPTQARLGNAIEDPQVRGLVWTRRFEKGTVKADLRTATATIG